MQADRSWNPKAGRTYQDYQMRVKSTSDLLAALLKRETNSSSEPPAPPKLPAAAGTHVTSCQRIQSHNLTSAKPRCLFLQLLDLWGRLVSAAIKMADTGRGLSTTVQSVCRSVSRCACSKAKSVTRTTGVMGLGVAFGGAPLPQQIIRRLMANNGHGQQGQVRRKLRVERHLIR